MNRARRVVSILLRLLSVLLLAGTGTQASAGSADLEGRLTYRIDGNRITVEIERIANNTSDVTTGPLYVTVWMTAGSDLYGSGHLAARHRITGGSDGRLGPGQFFSDMRWTLDYQAVPGTYFVHFFTSQDPEPYIALDSRTFTNTVDRSVVEHLEVFVEEGKSPGLWSAIIDEDGPRVIAAAGVRKHGARNRLTVNDLIHIGSNTKAMTATMLATLVADRSFTNGWQTTIVDVFPELSDEIHPAYLSVTLRQLVGMAGGIRRNAQDWWEYNNLPVARSRYLVMRDNLAVAPEGSVGEFLYSNLGYVVAGAMAERVADRTWESLMRTRLFSPLGVSTVGFGAPGTAGLVDQPWGHRRDRSGEWVAAQRDNARAMGPAGTVHITIQDWAKFIGLFLPELEPPVLDRASVDELTQPIAGSYASGWGLASRTWARGIALNHTGSNTYWNTHLWVAPEIGRAFVAAANSWDDDTSDMLDGIVYDLVTYAAYEAREDTGGDDHGNSRSTATRVALPSTTAGAIDPGDDIDYFRFEVSTRGTLVIESSGDLDTVGTLIDASGSRVEQDDDGAGYPNFRIERTLDEGTYYLRVHSYQAATGSYTLHLRGVTGDDGDGNPGDGGGDDHGNTRSSATLVSLPSTTPGIIDPGEDEDYFRFEVSGSGTVVMESSGDLDVVGALFDAGGDRIALDDDEGAGFNFRMERTLDAGTYYIRVHSYWAESGAYTLHLRTGGGDDSSGAGSDDHGNTRSTATRIALPSTTVGTIDPGNDTDHFRFEVPARGVVVMESTGGLDTVGTLFNARGGRIVQDDDGAGFPNFRIERTLGAGTYYVRVHSSGRATGGYALHLRGGGDDSGHGLRISTSTGSSVQPLQVASLAVEGGTAGADYDILVDLSGTGAFEAENTIEVLAIRDADDRLLMAAPLPETLPKGNAAHLLAVRVRERGGEAASNTLMLTLAETNVPPSLAGQPTVLLDMVLKGVYIGSDDPLLAVEAGAIEPGRSVRSARALGLSTGYSDAQAAALLRSLFDTELVVPAATGARSGRFLTAAGQRGASVRCLVPAACAAIERLVGCADDAMQTLRDDRLEGCARREGRALYEAFFDFSEKVSSVGNLLRGIAPRMARVLGLGRRPAQTVHDINAAVRQGVGMNKTFRTVTERAEALEQNFRALRDTTRTLTEDLPDHVAAAERDVAAAGVDDEEREAFFAIVEEADHHYSDAAAIEELEDVYTGEADVGETLGTVAEGDGGTSGGAMCGSNYEEFPVDDKTSTCVWNSLVEWSCYAGSRHVSHPDLGGANACLYYSLDFFQPDGTCRENYAKVTFLGRETCRWAELGADKAAWYTLEKEEGVKSPQTPPGSGAGGAPGESFRDCDMCPAMVSVPAGSFPMGAPESEPWSNTNERPQRTVSVPAFAASAYEVTFAEWDRCVAEGGCGGYSPDDEGWGRGNRPVINVSWDDAQLYVAWLSRKTGETYQLPTEAEWEYAARAGTTSPFNTGGTISPQQANFDGRYGYPDGFNDGGLYRRQTVPVGSFAPNTFGLHDVHGNVWEWVQDCYGSYGNAPSDGRASEGGDCSVRVSRGGSWDYDPRDLRSAYRGGNDSGLRSDISGFRVVRTLAP